MIGTSSKGHFQLNTFDVSTLLGRNLRLALEHSVFPMDSKVTFVFNIIVAIIVVFPMDSKVTFVFNIIVVIIDVFPMDLKVIFFVNIIL